MSAPEQTPSPGDVVTGDVVTGDAVTDEAAAEGGAARTAHRSVRVRNRLGALGVAAGLALLTLLQGFPPSGTGMTPVQALVVARNTAAVYGLQNAVTGSAVTLSGTGDYADLTVTVGQTKDLVNQSVVVTWAWGGATPGRHATIRNGSAILANYLQIMQCWGDTAPDRTQCEFGGFRSLQESGVTYSASRRIFPPSGSYTGPVDPAETVSSTDRDFLYQGDQGDTSRFAVPFATVNREIFRHDGTAVNPFYGEFDTNEIPYAVTRGDGKGFETFETLSFRESAGLGCADIPTSGTGRGKPRSCWLVVVPRGTKDVDGRDYTQISPSEQLQSSPLSASNWANRIVFPLNFAPIGQPCPISAKQRLVGGVETSSEAVLRWQPALCSNGGAVYGYSKLADAVAEGPLTGGGSATRGLSFLNRPVDPGSVPSDRTLVYAPIAVSGLTIAALVERTPTSSAPTDVQNRRGERMADLRLTPRLVAKLLTQSYGAAVEPNVTRLPGYLSGNPYNIDTDPEFLALNPEFTSLTGSYIQIMLPTGVSATTQVLWNWIATDAEARDFVAGVKDPYGMRVNPFYQGLQIPQQTLPKIDPYCRRDSSAFRFPQLCAFDLHPAVADFREAARQVSRGDTLSLQWPTYLPGYKLLPTDPVYQRVSREPPGARQIFGVTDTATAARYQLTTVKLRNAAGQFVAPTTASLLAGAASMRPSGVPGVSLADPQATSTTAYPLTVITYAAAAPNQLTADAAKDYAAFVRFAAGPGQTPGTAAGTLPDGYAPLPAALRKQALRVADQIQARIGPRTPRGGGDNGGSGSGSGNGSAPSGATPTVTAVPVPAPTPGSTTALGSSKPAVSRTPADAAVNALARYGFVIAATLGLLGLLIGPLLPRLAERIRR